MDDLDRDRLAPLTDTERAAASAGPKVAGGSQAAAKAAWTPLAGRKILIWPDADEPGAKYAGEVARVVSGHFPLRSAGAGLGCVRRLSAALDAALAYIGRGWSPIPVGYREKGPKLKDWQKLRITAETAGRYFNGGEQNIG